MNCQLWWLINPFICWLQLLKCEDLLLFLKSVRSLWVLDCRSDKRSHLKTRVWALGNLRWAFIWIFLTSTKSNWILKIIICFILSFFFFTLLYCFLVQQNKEFEMFWKSVKKKGVRVRVWTKRVSLSLSAWPDCPVVADLFMNCFLSWSVSCHMFSWWSGAASLAPYKTALRMRGLWALTYRLMESIFWARI